VTANLPLLIFYPTSRCNSRCVSCEWWKSSGDDDLTLGEIAELASLLPAIGTRVVAFSGGEPLLRRDLFEIAALFRARNVRLELLTSGVLLKQNAREVADVFSRVTVSLDAARHDLYRAVRGIDALEAVEEGIERLRRIRPSLSISARATLHKANFRELPALVAKARSLSLDGISFLAADVSSLAFGRRHAPPSDGLTLDRDEIVELRSIIDDTIRKAPARGTIAESPEKLRRIPDYYRALNGDGAFPKVSCNAPWISAVVEANGSVRPCFFHEAIGNVRETPLPRILAADLPAFRRRLDVAANPLCQRCVCSINQRSFS
jgi:MoaA/NifB/PqqE/SkfB family radical SAM enzyme